MIVEALATMAAIPLCVYLFEGVSAPNMEFALMTGAVLAVVNLLLRAPLRFLAKPLGCLTLGLMGTVVDAVLVELCAYFMQEGFSIASFPWALAVALVVNVLRCLARLLLGKRK